jgi:hypothetical protein
MSERRLADDGERQQVSAKRGQSSQMRERDQRQQRSQRRTQPAATRDTRRGCGKRRRKASAVGTQPTVQTRPHVSGTAVTARPETSGATP